MIGYVTVGTNDVPRAQAFYDALLGELGATRIFADAKYTFYGIDWQQPMVAICAPFDGQPAVVGNGAMVALQCPDRATVDRIHAKALALGGADEGAPGLREPEDMHFYGAYFRDLDGNKFCAFKMGAE